MALQPEEIANFKAWIAAKRGSPLVCPVCGATGDDAWGYDTLDSPAGDEIRVSYEVHCLACGHMWLFAMQVTGWFH